MWVNKFIKILGNGDGNSVWQAPARCGFSMTIWATLQKWANTASTGERHLERRKMDLSAATGCPACVLGFFFHFLLGSKKNGTRTLNFAYFSLESRWWWTSWSETTIWKLLRGFRCPVRRSRSPARLVIKVLATDLSACVEQNCTLVFHESRFCGANSGERFLSDK